MVALRALLGKELLELRRNHAVLLPLVAVMLVFITIPAVVALVIPSVTNQPLGDDRDLAKVSAAVGLHPELSTNGRVQLFLFQQFLVVFLLMPITGSMTLASHAIVGEKQARSLEPLLATPITTTQLLLAKVLGSLLPTMAISGIGLILFAAIVATAAEPGVMQAMLGARTLALVLAIGPTAALLSLQLALIVSSRVNDARTAQQFGVLLVMPLAGLIVAQFTGTLWLSAAALGLIALGLLGLWILLLLLSVVLFDREMILTRWR